MKAGRLHEILESREYAGAIERQELFHVLTGRQTVEVNYRQIQPDFKSLQCRIQADG